MEGIKKNFKLCEICENEATGFCLKCFSYFCDKCFKYVHENNKTKNNHKKEKIDYFVPIDTKCPDHTQNPINLFCIDEKGNNIILI